MKYKLGGQRPLDIRDVRAKLQPSLVGTFLVAPAVLLAVGLLLHFVLQAARHGAQIVVPVAIGLGSLVLVWGAVALFPSPNPDRPR